VKKLVVAAGVAVLALAACGETNKSQSGGNDATTTSTATALTSSSTASTSTSGYSTAGTITVPSVVGKDLQLAQDTMQAAGLYNLKSHDSTGRGRLQVLDRNWRVTDQSPSAGATVTKDQLIDLGARKFTD
jgi:hypothetical protein